MKGRFELPQNIAIIMVGVGGTMLFLIMTIINMGTSVEILEKNIEQLNAFDAARIVEKCLKNGQEYILEVYLDDNKGEDLCKVCGMCEIKPIAWVENLETGKKWGFHRTTTSYDSTLLVSIELENGEVNIGRLHVKI